MYVSGKHSWPKPPRVDEMPSEVFDPTALRELPFRHKSESEKRTFLLHGSLPRLSQSYLLTIANVLVLNDSK